MGYGKWSDDDYATRETVRKTAGKSAFTYTDDVSRNVSRDQWKTNPLLDPAGKTRESRDSAAHPESLAIAVLFDVTGSMQVVPRVCQQQLPRLMGLLLQKGWVEHPQVLFGAVGDATCDRAPLQAGQFESGVEMNDDFGRFLLEGGGGGSSEESYELAIYFAAKHTSIDCWEKRQKKGYLILIGDERPYGFVKSRELDNVIGDKAGEDIPIEQAIRGAQEKYYVFMIRPKNTFHGGDPDIQKEWESLLGKKNVIRLDAAEAIAETIALLIGLNEGKTALKDGIETLKKFGLNAELARAVERSLASAPVGGKTTTSASKPKKPDDLAEKKDWKL